MFSLFKKKSPADKLQAEYDKLMKEAHRLSTVNRAESDAMYAKANEIGKEIDKLNQQG